MRNLFLLLLLIASFWACQPEDACISSATNRLVIDFVIPTDSVPARDSVYFFEVRSTASDSLFYDNSITKADSVTRLLLRLDPDSDTTTFLFTGNAGRIDVVVLAYQRRYRLVSPDCPLEVRYEQLQLVNSTFTDLTIINTELIEPSDDTDVQVFY